MKAVYKETPLRPQPQAWTRVDIPAGAFLEQVYLTNTTPDVTIDVKMKINGLLIVDPISKSDTFSLIPDSAFHVPEVFLLKHSSKVIIMEFDASGSGACACLLFFEKNNPPSQAC